MDKLPVPGSVLENRDIPAEDQIFKEGVPLRAVAFPQKVILPEEPAAILS